MGGIYVFTLANVPVWISPWYLLIVFIFSRHQPTVPQMFAVAAAMTVSLLVHEFGHALTAKRKNLNPQVLLHGMGGLCQHDRAKSNGDDAKIIAAGPLSGLSLGVLSWLYVVSAGPPGHPVMQTFMSSLIWFNLVWSIFNLLPLWPMDGGQLYRLLMLRFFKPALAERVTHGTALVLLASLAFFAWSLIGPFAVLILALLGMQNYRALREGSGAAPVQRESRLAVELLLQAEDAWARGDDDEAVRLCHQLRAESNVGEKVLGRAWQILGVAATRRESYAEALSYLKRAPKSREVVEALAQCFYQLDQFAELRALTESPEFRKLDAETRRQVQAALEETEGEA